MSNLYRRIELGDGHVRYEPAAAEIERLTAENERLRHALMTIRDDLSSVTVTGEEIHCIVGCIGDALHQQQAVNSEEGK